jgi:choline-sulfatase
LGEHHEQTHGIFLYDSTLHVPLILKLPGTNTGRVIQRQVRTTDILPTVLNALDISPPERLDGESLKPYFAGTQMASRTVFGETDYPLHFGWAPLRAIRTEEFKFIEAPRPELYDLRTDPGELKNNYAPWDATVQKSRKMLADVRARMPPPAPSAGAVEAKGRRLHFEELDRECCDKRRSPASPFLATPNNQLETSLSDSLRTS